MFLFVGAAGLFFLAILLSFLLPRHPRKILSRIPLIKRFVKVKHFCALTHGVLWDLAEALREEDSQQSLVALSPLIQDVRKRGEQLLAEQGAWHRLVFRSWERRLTQKVQALIQAEKWLKFNLAVVPKREAS